MFIKQPNLGNFIDCRGRHSIPIKSEKENNFLVSLCTKLGTSTHHSSGARRPWRRRPALAHLAWIGLAHGRSLTNFQWNELCAATVGERWQPIGEHTCEVFVGGFKEAKHEQTIYYCLATIIIVKVCFRWLVTHLSKVEINT